VQAGHYETGSIYKSWSNNIRLLARMYAVPTFRTAYLDRMREFSGTIFKPERFRAQVAEIAPVIRPAVMDEPNRLARFDASAGRRGLCRSRRSRRVGRRATREAIDDRRTAIDSFGRSGRASRLASSRPRLLHDWRALYPPDRLTDRAF
jgi:hypothetical protein